MIGFDPSREWQNVIAVGYVPILAAVAHHRRPRGLPNSPLASLLVTGEVTRTAGSVENLETRLAYLGIY